MSLRVDRSHIIRRDLRILYARLKIRSGLHLRFLIFIIKYIFRLSHFKDPLFDETLPSFVLTFILVDFLDVERFGEWAEFHAILLADFEFILLFK